MRNLQEEGHLPALLLGGEQPTVLLTCKVQVFYVALLYPLHQLRNPDVILLNDCNLGFQLLVLGCGHVPLEATKAFFVHPSSNKLVFNNEVL